MLQILFATFAQLISFQLALSYGYPEYESPFEPQRQLRANVNFTCTAAGRFPNPESCSQYYLCWQITTSSLSLSHMVCPNVLVFDPVSRLCTTPANYTCPSTNTTTPPPTSTTTPTVPPNACQVPGHICHSITNFTFCAGLGVPVLVNQTCPSGYYCNNKCITPCVNHVSLC